MKFSRGAALLLIVTACPLPSLPELEKDSRSSCDLAHPCADGWHCGSDGFCAQNGSTGACSEGATMMCGMMQGECRFGSMTCSGGKFGDCTGGVGPAQEVCNGKDDNCDGTPDNNAVDSPLCALQQGVCAGTHAPCDAGCTMGTYGTDYEPTETKCDGKDNDCNGVPDDVAPMSCTKQQGACMGAKVSCIDAGYALECSPQIFSANNPAFETFETKCDGVDNDCDGKVDAWAATSVSNSPGAKSRRATAVAVPGSSGDLLVLWEEEEPVGSGTFKVKARHVGLDNAMSPVVSPSTTASSTPKNSLPALAVDGNTILGGWIEELSNGVKRVAVATLDPATGLSTFSAMGASIFASGSGTQLNDVSLAVDSVAGRGLVAIVDGSALRLVLTDGQGVQITEKVGVATGVAHTRVAPAGGGNFWLTWEDTSTGNIQRCIVDSGGNKSCAASATPARSPAFYPVNGAAPFAGISMFLADVDAGVQRIFTSSCADGGLCAAPQGVGLLRPAMQDLRATPTARSLPPVFSAWDEGGQSFHYLVSNRTDGGLQPAGPSPGQRPTPVFTGTNRGAVVFDTEGTTSGAIAADEVFVARFCF